MGIQDRDYWRERYWEQQGEKAPKRAFSPTGNDKKRSFRIVDKVRVRPDNYIPDEATTRPPQHASYGVGIALVLCVAGLLGFFVYKLFLL